MILEQKIQSSVIKSLRKKGWLVIKTIRLSESGYPDIFAFKDSTTIFVEVKSEKGKLSELQQYRIDNLKSQGFKVIVCNSIESFETEYLIF